MGRDLKTSEQRFVRVWVSVRGGIVFRVKAAERAVSHVGMWRMEIGKAGYVGSLEGLAGMISMLGSSLVPYHA